MLQDKLGLYMKWPDMDRQPIRAFAMPADFVEASAPCSSGHQMGSARMGADPHTSVCDPNGESWDVSGLFICDGSALPTSIGASCNLQIIRPCHRSQPQDLMNTDHKPVPSCNIMDELLQLEHDVSS